MKKSIPFDFVLEELAPVSPITKPMFGCTSVYVGEKIVLILRQRGKPVADDGVWLATTQEHHASLQKDFPSMKSIELFGPGVTGWQVLPAGSSHFERDVFKACEMILKGDPRIGKIPKAKLPRQKKTAKKAAPKKKKPRANPRLSKSTKISRKKN